MAATSEEDTVIAKGVALRKAGDDAGASEVFRRAYERSHSPRSAAQLGLAEQALGRWENAEMYIGEALRAEDDTWINKNREELRRAMVVIKDHIARIEILGDPAGADIIVNGRRVGSLPLSAPVSISAGEVDVEARADGYERQVRKLSLVGGQYQRLVIRLDKVGAARAGADTGPAARTADPLATTATTGAATTTTTPTTTTAATTTDGSAPAGWRIAKWTALGLAVVGVGTGIAATVVRGGALEDFKSAHNGACMDKGGRGVDASGTPIAECQAPLNTFYSAKTWQIVGFAAGGALAVTWLVLTLAEPSPSGATASRDASLRWACGPTGALTGAACMLRF